eukprot:TRINITY_DN8823_c0_g1_i1.p1 TRINITY_DN8823_c0_g1~~TRINITY_DN8823_c0_g1_i1.p1  ORF type:complete len:946 (+),score=239.85 TRINITY_DN8823_c0_g1_i1:77-2839(+)
MAEGWERVLDPVSGRFYYANRRDFSVRWDPPPGFGDPAPDRARAGDPAADPAPRGGSRGPARRPRSGSRGPAPRSRRGSRGPRPELPAPQGPHWRAPTAGPAPQPDEQPDEQLVEPRPYQRDAIAACIARNTVLCMATGTGKTLVAARVIKHMLADNLDHRAVMLVPTRALAHQQSAYLREQLGRIGGGVDAACGDEALTWGETDWRARFATNRVIVGTAEIMKTAIVAEYIPTGDLRVVIVDECHNVTGNSPMLNFLRAMWDYIPNEAEGPRVVGLTASFIHGRMEKLEIKRRTLLKELRATMLVPDVPAEFLPTQTMERVSWVDEPVPESAKTAVEEHITDELFWAPTAVGGGARGDPAPEDEGEERPPPRACVCVGGDSESDSSEDDGASNGSLRSSDSYLDDPYCQPGDEGPDRAGGEAPTEIAEIEERDVRRVALCGAHILENLGPRALGWWWREGVVQEFTQRARQAHAHALAEPDPDRREEKMAEAARAAEVAARLERRAASPAGALPESIPELREVPAASAKLRRLVELLRSDELRDGDPGWSCIIFVGRNAVAYVLAWALNDSLGKQVAVPLAGIGAMKERVRRYSLQCFTEQKVPILVATAAVEEGVDISSCCCVIRFDQFHTTKQHIQGAGRARARNARILYFENAPEQEEADASRMRAAAVEGHAAAARAAPAAREPTGKSPQEMYADYCIKVLGKPVPKGGWERAADGSVLRLWWPSPDGWEAVTLPEAPERPDKARRGDFCAAVLSAARRRGLLDHRGQPTACAREAVRRLGLLLRAQLPEPLRPAAPRAPSRGRQRMRVRCIPSAAAPAEPGPNSPSERSCKQRLNRLLQMQLGVGLKGVAQFATTPVAGAAPPLWKCEACFARDPESRCESDARPSKRAAEEGAAGLLLQYLHRKQKLDRYYRP